MAKEYFSGNADKCLQMQFDMTELVKALFCEVNPIPVKTAAALMGLCTEFMRWTFIKMQKIENLNTALRNFGINFKE